MKNCQQKRALGVHWSVEKNQGGFGYVLKPISWVLGPNLPSLADFIKTNEKPVLAGFAQFVAKATKPLE